MLGTPTSARARLLAALGAGGLGVAVGAALLPWQVAVLTGWNAAAAVWIVLVVAGIVGRDAAATRAVATREDNSRAAADVILIVASITSLAGVVLALMKAAHAHGASHVLITAAAGLTVVLSWAVVHLLFTLRYARLYYEGGGDGIDFHDGRQADYGDFAYVALTIGMTYQVSDTDLTAKPIRRTALRHALLSYLFGTGVVAMTINIVAGLVTK